MSDEEKLRRHTKLYQTVTTQTSHTWATTLAKMLLEQLGGQNLAKQTPFIPKDLLEGSYIRAKKRLFLFDYDVCYRLLCAELLYVLLTVCMIV